VYIKAFSAAFEGGQKPEGMSMSVLRHEMGSSPLSDEDAMKIAWGAAPTRWTGIVGGGACWTIANTPDVAIAAFWKEVYAEFNVIEHYGVELPYGEVPK
jgi:hypothetical protein